MGETRFDSGFRLLAVLITKMFRGKGTGGTGGKDQMTGPGKGVGVLQSAFKSGRCGCWLMHDEGFETWLPSVECVFERKKRVI